MTSFIETERHGPVAVIALNRPEARNALGMGLTLELRRAIRAASEDATIRAVILTGRGRAFSAGADVHEWAEKLEGRDPYPDLDWVEESLKLVQQIHDMPKPTIAMIDGAAVGAGLDIALACDFRYASHRAKFICSYLNVGYAPDCGGSWLMPRIMGLETAKRFAYGTEVWDGQQAFENRLVSHVTAPETLWEETLAYATRLASGPTVAIGLTKALMQQSFTRSLADQLIAEQAAGKICGKTQDHAEGLAAANARRAPVFTGA
ncbi:enoyl-CoA hydratase/isomerase family protein [Paracoccus aminophilus]|uniref:Enoyl-CoA hydratase n=1 Tax=Paracoccus aminophilus JCM 7686 TaxID=1367847 RepID=S5Y220_PARAH|nr:enoyl-CoA hydratase/isomerase family protein [Paracoccus aminophilus]AGT09785.1 enoyl-CoA hydratase [Paracoccus aminophilus JCM 7686]